MITTLFLFSLFLHSTLAQIPAIPHNHNPAVPLNTGIPQKPVTSHKPAIPHQPKVANIVKKWSTLSGL